MGEWGGSWGGGGGPGRRDGTDRHFEPERGVHKAVKHKGERICFPSVKENKNWNFAEAGGAGWLGLKGKQGGGEKSWRAPEHHAVKQSVGTTGSACGLVEWAQ